MKMKDHAIVKKSHMKNGSYIKSGYSYKYYLCVSASKGRFYSVYINDIIYYYKPKMFNKYYTEDIVYERKAKLERLKKLLKKQNP